MGAVRDADVGTADALGLELVDLAENPGEVHDDAVSNDAGRLGVKDARWDQMKRVLLTIVVVDGVAGVGATLAAGDNVGVHTGCVT